MSTRSTTHFVAGDVTEAIVYRHTDGYPEGHGRDLFRFFEAVQEQTADTRFADPSYLAAKLVVFLAREFAVDTSYGPDGFTRASHAETRPLDFLSVGVVREDPGDVEYIYVVDCASHDERGFPLVRCHEAALEQGYDGPVTLGAEVPIPALEAAS